MTNDGERLAQLLGNRNRAEFARSIGLRGGGSLISQHISGHRPISLDAAVAYARGLGVPLVAVSPSHAKQVAEAASLLGTDHRALPPPDPLTPVLAAVAALTPGRWAMVRARLDDLPEHPERVAEVAADVRVILEPPAAPARRGG